MVAKRGSFTKRAVLALLVVVAVLAGACVWYVSDYYHADGAALAAVADADGASGGVEVRRLDGGGIAFVPEAPVAGFVFYPGAKVQPEAYAPLMRRCAERGILCVLLEPLFNLAILDADAADGVVEQFPDVAAWAIGGHSMGGVAAADYLSRHGEGFAVIAFLASYPSADLSGFAGRSLSIVGSNDLVLNRDAYEGARQKLPSNAEELVIDGGNHAYFGDYGEQSGDGEATIAREEQQEQAAAAIAELMAEG